MRKRLKILYLLTLKEFRNFRLKKKYFVFVFFLFLSTIFWFLNALDKEYTSFIDVPFKFINQSKSKVLTHGNGSTKKLNIKINSRGFKIFNYNSTFLKKAIRIKSDSKFVGKFKEDSLRLFVATANLKNIISAHLGEDFKIINIQPDSLFFQYENTVDKRVKVEPNLTINFKRQFFQSGPTLVSPDSVTVLGTKELVDDIEFVNTQLYEFDDADDNLNIVCELEQIKGLRYQVSSVNVSIPIEEFTEKTLNIPIEVRNLPAKYELKLFPHSVQLQFNTSISNYLKIKPDDFTLFVDYNEISEKSNDLKINLVHKSEFAIDLKYFPTKVEYILEK